MRVLVLGSGVIGVTSAWYLAGAGHEVTVLDRQPAVAMETSFANAGQISPGYAAPWAAPGVPLKALKWMFQKHAPLSVRLDGTLFQLRWMWQMLANCNARSYAINKSRMVRLSEYSRDCLDRLRSETGLNYEGRSGGTLQVFRSARQRDAAVKDMRVLADAGVRFELLEPAELARVEPGLAHSAATFTGALRLPGDETGDCQMFTDGLATLARQHGVRFLHEVDIEGLLLSGDKVRGVQAGGVSHYADAVVVALGAGSMPLLRGLVDLPVYPVKGYSITVPVVDAQRSPVSTVLDETYKVAVTRFDQRIRVGGMAHVVGYDLRLDERKRKTLEYVVDNLFPGAGNLRQASFWTGLRPMTPDGTPLIGKTPIRGLWLNTGHGTLGWTMACGSARVLADQISQRVPEIESADLSISRYSSHLTRTCPAPYTPVSTSTR